MGVFRANPRTGRADLFPARTGNLCRGAFAREQRRGNSRKDGPVFRCRRPGGLAVLGLWRADVSCTRKGRGVGTFVNLPGFSRASPAAVSRKPRERLIAKRTCHLPKVRSLEPGAQGGPYPEGKGADLTAVRCQTSLCDMPTSTATTREFIRNFARLKKVAANGGEIIVRDRRGRAFVFRAKDRGPSLADQLSDLCGVLKTGQPRKSLDGFGRNRK